jgi:hypothetical protein
MHWRVSTYVDGAARYALRTLQILEVDVDDVPWKDTIVTHVPPVVNGALHRTCPP